MPVCLVLVAARKQLLVLVGLPSLLMTATGLCTVINFLTNMLSKLCCTECEHNSLHLTESTCYGLATKLIVQCNNCETKMFFHFASPSVTEGHSYDINDRFVYACKSNGLNCEQACSFIADLNLPKPISAPAYLSKLGRLAKSCEKSLAEHMKIPRAIIREEYVKAGKANSDD